MALVVTLFQSEYMYILVRCREFWVIPDLRTGEKSLVLQYNSRVYITYLRLQ